MFSDKSISEYINQNFEPAWQSLRPVPLVTIDFGNGNKLKRTLHGNIATYVCTKDRTVVDVLPGLYKPDAYLQALRKVKAVANTVRSSTNGYKYLERYHKHMLASVQRWQRLDRHNTDKLTRAPITFAANNLSDRNQPPADLTSNVALWQELSDETAINENVRRRQIHFRLAQVEQTTPEQLRNWLYREVLHCDLNDPYLGLKAALFDNYPFVD